MKKKNDENPFVMFGAGRDGKRLFLVSDIVGRKMSGPDIKRLVSGDSITARSLNK